MKLLLSDKLYAIVCRTICLFPKPLFTITMSNVVTHYVDLFINTVFVLVPISVNLTWFQLGNNKISRDYIFNITKR